MKDGSTLAILTHPYFDSIDINALRSCHLKPSHIPPASNHNEPLFHLPGVKRFRGDQSIFETF